MNYKEYGKEHKDVIILLHGGGLNWWNYREEAEILKNNYHVIIPILDGHSGSNRPFSSIKENADDIIRFIDEQFGGKVLMMGGLSLGGQILLETLSTRTDICRYTIIESAMVIPSKTTHALIRPALGCSYGLIKKRWFSKLQFNSLHIKPNLFEEYYRDTCKIKKEDYIALLLANTEYTLQDSIRNCTADIHIFFGQKEKAGIKKSAKAIHETVPGSKVHVLPNLYHGEFSINHAKKYAGIIQKIIQSKT